MAAGSQEGQLSALASVTSAAGALGSAAAGSAAQVDALQLLQAFGPKGGASAATGVADASHSGGGGYYVALPFDTGDTAPPFSPSSTPMNSRPQSRGSAHWQPSAPPLAAGVPPAAAPGKLSLGAGEAAPAGLPASMARRQHRIAALAAAMASGGPGGSDYLTLLDEATARQSSWAATNAITVLQVMLAVALGVTGFELRLLVAAFLFYASAAISSVGFVIMLCSLTYFTPRALCGVGKRKVGGGRGRNWCVVSARRLNAGIFFTGWLALATALVLMFVTVDSHRELYYWSAWTFFGVLGALLVWALLAYGLIRILCGDRGSCYRSGA